LFGTASAAAAIALKNYIENAEKISGTVKFYGCPAEEGGSGKVYMTQSWSCLMMWTWPYIGMQTVRILRVSVLHWPINPLNFRFYGVSAHAAGAPEKGRSASGRSVEAMNAMVNMLREHTTESTRIHYVITQGGKCT
jgi:aminobenzoyl-glutamate utilization protein B